MTAAAQSVDISVVGKKTAVTRYGVDSDMSLTEASVILLNVLRADIHGVARQGNDLVLTLTSGQVVSIRNYFVAVDGSKSNLVLQNESEGLWLMQLGDAQTQGDEALPFGFTNIFSIDPLLEHTPEEQDTVLGVWGASLAGLTIAAITANSLLHNDNPSPAPAPKPEDPIPPAKPHPAEVNLVNGFSPITGSAQPGMNITVTMPNGTQAHTTTDAQGHFSVSNPGLAHGSEITVVVTSPEGQNSEPVTVIVDALAPDAPTVGPVNAHDEIAGHAEPGSTVTITLPNGDKVPVVAGNDGIFKIPNPGGLHDGDKISVTATDPAGNVSKPTEVFVDAAMPTLVITDDIPGMVGKDGVVTFTFTFNEPVKGFDAGKIEVNGGTVGKFTEVSPSVYTLVVTPNAGAVGVITVSVGAGAVVDLANNPNEAASATQAFDTIAPTADALTSLHLWDDVGPKQGEIFAGDSTDDNKPEYRGTVDPSEVAFVRVFDNGMLLGTATVQPDGSWQFTPSGSLAAGPHQFEVQLVDAAGNESPLISPLPFVLEGPAPAAPAITGVYDDQGETLVNIQPGVPANDATPLLNGTATPGTIVKVYSDGVLVGSATVDAEGHWSLSTSPLADGEHKLTATATDGAGQVSDPTGDYLIVIDTIAPDKPEGLQAIDQVGDQQGPMVGGVTDDAAPEIKGRAEPNGTVTIYDNGQKLGTVKVGANGEWSFKPSSVLVDGNHSITATVVDKAGNVSAPSDALAFNVNTEGVELVIHRVLDDHGSIQGPIPNGGVTDDTTPTFEGHARPNATITIYDGTTVVASVKADGAGNWVLSLPEQGEGAHQYIIKAVSVAGNAVEASFTLTVDTTSSSVPHINEIHDDVGSIQTPLHSGGVTDDTTPQIIGTGTPGDTIHVYDNGSLIGTTVVDGSGAWSYTVHPALTAEGKHELSSTSVDEAGNESAHSDTFVVYLDVTPPDLSGVKLLIHNVTADNVVNAAESKTQVMLSGTLTGVPADVAQTHVVVSLNGVNYEATVSGNSWSVQVPGNGLVADLHHQLQVTVLCSDAAGNAAQLMSNKDYGVDTEGPNIIDDIPFTYALWDDVGEKQGQIFSGDVTDDSTPTYRGQTDPSEVALVQILNNGVVIGEAVVQADGSWMFEPKTPLSAGTYGFQLLAFDAAGNASPLTPMLDFSVLGAAPLPPSITGVYDDAGGNIQPHQPSNDATPTFKGTAAMGTIVKVYEVNGAGEKVLLGSVAVDGQGNWSLSTSNLGEGNHNIIATATDAAAQVSDPTGIYPVFIDTIAPGKPDGLQAIDLVGDKQGPITGGVTDDAAPEIKGRAEPEGTVTLYDNGQKLGTAHVGANGEWSFKPTTVLADGNHSITATVVDKAGNVSAPSDALTFNVNTEGMELVIQRVMDDYGSIQGPISNGGVTDDTTPTFEGRATPNATISIYEGTKLVASVKADGGGHWVLSLPVQSEGAHQYTIKAESVAGNVAEAPFALTVDITPSSVPHIVEVHDDVGSVQMPMHSGGVTDDTTPQIIGAGAPGDTVHIYDNGALIGTTVVDGSGGWSYTVHPALTAEGKHELSSTSVDQAGNESAHSDVFVIYLDVTPPDLSGAKLLIDDVTADNIVNAVEAQGSISLTGTLTGLPSDAKGVKISISLNGSTYDAIVNGTTWSVNVPGIQLVNDGDHQFEVKVTVSDEAGNAAQLDGSKWYEAITTPPGASSLSNIRLVDDVGAITGDIVNGTVTDDGKPTYMGKATADVVKVQILDNNQVIGEAIVDKNGMWSFEPAQPLTRGMHSFQVRAVDRAGNVGGPTVAIDFEMAGGPPAPPVIDPDIDSIAALFSDATPKNAEQKSVVTPSMFMPIATFASLVQEPAPPLSRGMVGDTLVTNKVNPSIKGTATPGDIVKLFDQLPSGELVPLGSAIADAQGKWSITTPALTEGLHRFVATSTDSAGQISGPSYEFPVLIDITAPIKPSLPEATDHTGDIQGPIANGGVTDEQSPVLHGKGEAGTKVTVYDNGSVMGTATVDHNGEWSLRPGAPLAEGAHKITVTLTDAAGNVSESSDALQFTVDTIAPETSTTIFYHDNVGANQGDFASGTSTDDRTPLLQGKLDSALAPGDQVLIYSGNTLLGHAVVSGQDWSFALAEPLQNGSSNTFTAKVTDQAGNAGVPVSLTLTIALSASVQTQSTHDTTPVIAGSFSGEVLSGEYFEVTVNGTVYTSKNGQVAVDVQNGQWYLQIPDTNALPFGTYDVTAQLKGATGSQETQLAFGAVNVLDPNPATEANTDWASTPGSSSNNTMVLGLNDAGLWTITANNQVYSSKDMSSYAKAALANTRAASVVSLTSADFDRNGTVDVLGTENTYGNCSQVMWANTSGSYSGKQLNMGTTIYWGAVIAYDKTGNGYLDMAYGDRYGDSVTYLVNNKGVLTPDGLCGDAGVGGCLNFSFGEVSGVDINNDGTVDIVRHTKSSGMAALSVISNRGDGSLAVTQSIAGVFYQNEANGSSAASMTWADFNGDGYMDLYVATGANQTNGAIYFNKGNGQLSSTAFSVGTASKASADAGFLSAAVDWNHDGQMDIVKLSTYGSSQTATLYTNHQHGASWTPTQLASKLINVTGMAVMDYNWDGAKDLILSQLNGKMVYVKNTNAIEDGTAMHLRILDSEGINVFYGNTVQLYNEAGKLVASQIINAQSGYGFNDTSGIVSFYGLDASETYSAKLLKITNGVTSNVNWNGLEAGSGKEGYVLTTDAATKVLDGTITGTGYNDTFIVEKGTHTYNGAGGWTNDNGFESWNKVGGTDIVDFRKSTTGIHIDLGKTGAQANGFCKVSLVDIEGVTSSDYADVLIGNAGNNVLEGRGGDDFLDVSKGGKDTLMYHSLSKTDALGGNGHDTVKGFSVGMWEASTPSDRIDLGDLLDGYKPSIHGQYAASYIDGVATIDTHDAIGQYLKVEQSGDDAVLMLDRTGHGGHYAALLTIQNVHTDLATLLANHQISLV